MGCVCLKPRGPVRIERKAPVIKPEVNAQKDEKPNNMMESIAKIEASEVPSNRGRSIGSSTADTLSRFTVVAKESNKDMGQVAVCSEKPKPNVVADAVEDVSQEAFLPAEPEQPDDVDSNQLAKLRQPGSNVE